jgi:hypothetical protein
VVKGQRRVRESHKSSVGNPDSCTLSEPSFRKPYNPVENLVVSPFGLGSLWNTNCNVIDKSGFGVLTTQTGSRD